MMDVDENFNSNNEDEIVIVDDDEPNNNPLAAGGDDNVGNEVLERQETEQVVQPIPENPVVSPNIKQPSKKRKLDESDDDDDDDISCPICMDSWTTSGEHRLSSIACGHLFGYSCIARWLKDNKSCPQCNAVTKMRDIRYIYASNLKAVDTAEIDTLKYELNAVRDKVKELDEQLYLALQRNTLQTDAIAKLTKKVSALEAEKLKLMAGQAQVNNGIPIVQGIRFYLNGNLDMEKESNCRVIEYSHTTRQLHISYYLPTKVLCTPFGIKEIDYGTGVPKGFLGLHKAEIREIATNPITGSILTVSFDKTAKVFDSRTNRAMHISTFETALWSACWVDRECFALGAQNGAVYVYDRRRPTEPLETFRGSDTTPVASLAPIVCEGQDNLPQYAFLSTQFKSAFAYFPSNGSYLRKPLLIDGSFFCIRYDTKTGNAMISCRPTEKDPLVKHKIFTIRNSQDSPIVFCDIVHEFNSGNTQTTISRPCFVNVGEEKLVAAYSSSQNMIQLWSITTGKHIQNHMSQLPVTDLCPFQTLNNDIGLAALSKQKLRLYLNAT